MPVVTANGISQHYTLAGPIDDPDAPIAVLIHGILIDSLASYFFTLANPFADAGVGTVMYDLRGHGKTDKPPTGYTMDDYAADLIGLLDTLGITRPVYLMGNSFGGSVALFTAARFPDRAAGVIMLDAEAPTPAWGERLHQVFTQTGLYLSRKEVMTLIRVGGGRHLHKQAKAALATLDSTRVGQELPHGAMLSTDELAAAAAPVLALYAGEWSIKDEAPLLPTWLPHCTTRILDGHTHSMLVEQPGTICELVLPWIAARHAEVRTQL